MALSILSKKPSIKKVLKLVFSGLSISFIAMLVIMLAYDTVTGASQSTQYCAKYGIFDSPACW